MLPHGILDVDARVNFSNKNFSIDFEREQNSQKYERKAELPLKFRTNRSQGVADRQDQERKRPLFSSRTNSFL